jgi:hypothetical protein
MPAPPDNGLLVIRFSPVDKPPPQVITRTVPRSVTPVPVQPVPTVPSSGS